MGRKRTDLLQGTLDRLILKTLQAGAPEGWGISKRIRETSNDGLQVNQGSLHPTLHRLEDPGWVQAEWGVSPQGRRAKFYELTKAGREQLAEERRQWALFSSAMQAVLAT